MKWNYLLSVLAILLLGGIVIAQDDVTYDTYTSDDGNISFDVPDGWLVTPFGPAFNLSTTGYVEMSDVTPGDQNVSIILLRNADLEAGGISQDMSTKAYTLAVLAFVSEGEEVPAVDENAVSAITLDSGIDAGTLDLALGVAKASVVVFQQDDVTIFVSSLAHESEFDTVKPIMMHVINSITLSENAGQAMSMPEYPVVAIVANEDEVVIPSAPEEGIPAGLYTFTFTNNRSEAPYSPVIGRLSEGVTMEQFIEAATTDDGMGAIFMLTFLGGTVVMPDQSVPVTVNLDPGDYVLVELSFEGPGDMQSFRVAENDAMADVEKPAADIEFTMVDFAFGIPNTLQSGELTWHILNAGEQWHEAAIFNVPEGTTVEDILASFESDEGNDEAFTQVFTWLPMGAGQEAWTTVNLEPGTYAILCFLPDLAGDFSPHIAQGMVQVFTVE